MRKQRHDYGGLHERDRVRRGVHHKSGRFKPRKDRTVRFVAGFGALQTLDIML